MSGIYEYNYFDEVPYYQKECCGGRRSKEQQKIDNAQDKAIKAEVERSTVVDDTQTQEIAELNEKIKNLNNEWHEA